MTCCKSSAVAVDVDTDARSGQFFGEQFEGEGFDFGAGSRQDNGGRKGSGALRLFGEMIAVVSQDERNLSR